VQMPVMDGFEATALIREEESTRGERTPIIALTARALRGDAERCLQAGMDDYAPKPITPQILAKAIERNLNTEDSDCPEDTALTLKSLNVKHAKDQFPYDRRALLERVADDKDMLVELVMLFLVEGPKMLTDIQRAVSTGNPEAIAFAAHALKGPLGILAADNALQTTQALESLAKSGDLQGAQETAGDLAAQIQVLISALEHETAETPASESR